MGFYLRKSLSVGPFRFNLSKSGIGVSAGVKGFRIGSGPRGNYIHMGRGGLYYRTSLSPGGGRPRTIPAVPSPGTGDNTTRDLHESLQAIESANVLDMVDSSSASLLEEINGKKNKIRLWPIFSVISLIVLFLLGASFDTFWPIYIFIPIALAAIYLVYMRDQVTKTTVLFYELEQGQEEKYQALHDAFAKIIACGSKWHVEAKGAVKDKKRTAGASSVINRKKVSPGKGNPSFLKTNISVPFMPAGKQFLYFFPDKLLVFDSNGAGAVNYKDLNVEVNPTRFIEDEAVPSDAAVVDKTWKFVNKSGGPDKRFKDNKEIPIVLYESVHLSSSTGLNELIQISKRGVGEDFKTAIYGLQKATQISQTQL